MPIFSLTEDLIFPDPSLAEDGILAIGGDLRPERLLLAYEHGIFPWYSADEPIVWHAPDPRFVLDPKNLKVSKSMQTVLRNHPYEVCLNRDFEQTISTCQQINRKGEFDTWITREMKDAYLKLHTMGFAHSVEVWHGGNLIGGLYGINLGKIFYGESMFHKESNTSKIALIKLIEHIPFKLIDCQVYTRHLASLGATNITLSAFRSIITSETKYPNLLNRNSTFVLN